MHTFTKNLRGKLNFTAFNISCPGSDHLSGCHLSHMDLVYQCQDQHCNVKRMVAACTGSGYMLLLVTNIITMIIPGKMGSLMMQKDLPKMTLRHILVTKANVNFK